MSLKYEPSSEQRSNLFDLLVAAVCLSIGGKTSSFFFFFITLKARVE